MPLGRYLEAGISVGLGSDVAGGPDLSLFGGDARRRLRPERAAGRRPAIRAPILDPLDWLRLGTLEGARALGLEAEIGSLEAGKEADLIAVDPRARAAARRDPSRDDPADILSR